jgi:hypothetical protein
MSTDVAKKIALPLDSIDDYDATIECRDGDGDISGGGGFLPVGERIAFGRAEDWRDQNDASLTGKRAIHHDTIRVVTHWGLDNKPVGPPRILGAGEPFPDTDALNECIPRTEWLPGFPGPDGTPRPRGPIQNQHICTFVDPATMIKYVWPSPVTTIGSAICVRELTEAVKRMRQFRGERIYAAVEFGKCPFKTRFGERQRPTLRICGWFRPTDHGLEPVDTKTLPGLQRVAEPSACEEMRDKIPW